MKQYKVLSQKDKWYSGKFDPEALEKALNSYASQGWEVKSAATASMPGLMGGSRDEMVIILEREDMRQADSSARASKVAEVAKKSCEAHVASGGRETGGEPPAYSL